MLPDPLRSHLPDPLPLGPASRYAGLPPAELLAWCSRLSSMFDLWWAELGRFRSLGVSSALGGPCARGLLEAREDLLREAAALSRQLEVHLAEVRTAVAR